MPVVSVGTELVQSEEREVHTSGVPRVKVENDAGLIEVVAWEHDHIRVEAEKHGRDQAALDCLVIEVSGGTDEVLVTYSASDRVVDAWVDFRVTCPRASSLDLHNASGEIVASGLHGECRASTASGTIRIAGVRGSSTLTSASGAIHGAALEGTVYARSASGAINLRGELGDGHRLETASGPIDVDGIRGAIDARSASGSIRVAGQFTGQSRLRSVSGDVIARLLPGSDVTVAGDRTPPLQVGGGAGMLVLETTSGAVRVERAEG